MFTPGDYICVDINSSSPGAWLADHAIKWFTNSKFCHAFIYADADGTIIESTPREGVHASNIREYSGMTTLGSSTALTAQQRAGIVKSAQRYVGRTGYGFLDIAYLSMYLSGINWNWLESEVLEENDQTICSQLVAMCGAANGVKSWLCGKSHPNLVTPADLANLSLKELK